VNEWPKLCQALLNGPCSPAILGSAESVLSQALTRSAAGAYTFGSFEALSWRLKPGPSGEPTTTPGPLLLKSLAPLALVDGIWLARAAQPATGHLPAACRLLRIYSETVGVDHPVESAPLHFRAKLTEAGITLPSIDSPEFFHAGFREPALKAAAMALIFMHRPLSFASELLGYTLAHLCREPEPWENSALQTIRLRHQAWAREALEIGLAEGMSESLIDAGWRLSISMYEGIHEDCLSREAQPASTREDQFANLIQGRRNHALGYHYNIRLGDQSLDEWLANAQEDSQPLLRALHNSPLINRACPASSRLIRAMEFGGPMFGVFSPQERKDTLAWIEDPRAPGVIPDDAALGAGSPKDSFAFLDFKDSRVKPTRSDRQRPRELYLDLLQAESPSDTPPEADRLIQKILKRTRWLGVVGLGDKPFAYTPEGFTRFVETGYQKQVGRYRPRKGPPRVDKAFCQWAVLQLAPAILVDGAWLAGIPTAAEKLGPVRRQLLKIYVDELGNGRADWNHPNIYRRLLESQRLSLPDFTTDAFAQHPALLDSAFELPVYLLAMGLLSDRYLPEVLGLNLAIELSGLGASYLRAIELLRHHGMDPTIVELHLSIDNLATGHAARARDAIVLYLEEVRQREGVPAVDQVWKRIWLGYKSLHAATLTLSLNIVGRYALHRAGRRVDPQGMCLI